MAQISHKQELYAIQNARTGEFLSFGGKIGWVSSVAAKNAFNLHMKTHYQPLYGDPQRPWQSIANLFGIQTDYELVVFDTFGTSSIVEKEIKA